MTWKSPYGDQHAPDKDSLLVPDLIKRGIANQLRRRRILRDHGLDENKQFKSEALQLAYTKRIEDVLKGL